MLPFSVIFNDSNSDLKGVPLFIVECLRNDTCWC